MKNAVDIGNEFLNKLPALEKPQYTQVNWFKSQGQISDSSC